MPEASIPQKALSAYQSLKPSMQARSKGLVSICFNPMVSLPNSAYVRAAYEKLEYYARHRFLSF